MVVWMGWFGVSHATWSIVATEPATERIGGAGTSCVGSLGVSIIYGGAPGFGAIHSQALLNPEARDEGVRLLEGGASPEQVIGAITDPSFDGAASLRQHGVVDLSARSDGFTGENTTMWTGDIQGQTNGVTWSAQGNILTSAAVIQQSVAALEAPACDLPERLLAGLVAGGLGGEGDARCTSRGVPSDSAFLRVQEADGTDVVFLEVVDTGNTDPLVLLQARFDQWRLANPCSDPPDTADTAPPIDSAVPEPPAPPSSTTPGDDPPLAAPPTVDGSTGCGCASGPTAPWALWVGLIGILGRRSPTGATVRGTRPPPPARHRNGRRSRIGNRIRGPRTSRNKM